MERPQLRRADELSASVSASAVFSQTFTRDKLGRITTKTETFQGVTDIYVYGYDPAGRLETVTKNGTLLSQYTYDANGNRQTKTTAAGTAVYTTDNQDRLTSWTLAPDTWNLTYTANGELQSKTNGSQTTTYSYDVVGNLRYVTLPDGTQIEYIIDAQNRRVGKKVNGVLTQAWLYGNQLNPVAELNGSGSIVSTFVYASRSNVPEYIVKAGITYRILCDHLGSPRLVINASDGSIAQRLDYDEFGGITQDTNLGFQPYGFAGGLYDSQIRLTRFGERDYDPEVGRWIGKDPVGFDGGDTNLFGYVMGDPMNGVDPDGNEVIYRPGVIPPAQPVRDLLGQIDTLNGDRDVIVTSGGRPPERNRQAGGRPRSNHLTGNAADIFVPGQSSEETAAQAAEAGAGGISTYDRAHGGHTHVDVRTGEWNGHNSETLGRRPRWRNPVRRPPVRPRPGRTAPGGMVPCP